MDRFGFVMEQTLGHRTHYRNLRRYIEALGGKLEITARFPDASVVIDNVGDT